MLAAALMLTTGCIHRHHTFVDKTQTDLDCKIVTAADADFRCHVVITNTQKW